MYILGTDGKRQRRRERETDREEETGRRAAREHIEGNIQRGTYRGEETERRDIGGET
jgi:hypothetical protein